jgi:GDP-4-dehydro-6-deoxy-D-mannose reductase
MRVLVTGASGFVGQHLVRHLRSRGHSVFGTYFSKSDLAGPRTHFLRCDIRNARSVLAVVRDVRPHHIFHLAAQSSPVKSANDLEGVFRTNFWGTFNVLEAVRHACPVARLLVVTSGQCYGPVRHSRLPIKETEPFAPANPYALSKAAADMLAGQYYSRFGLHVIRARPFNHSGPGQDAAFVCSDFARQVAAIDLGFRKPVLFLGDLHRNRDFTDVRDVVTAYELLLEKAPPGEAYNVASGRASSLKEVVRMLVSLSSRPIRLSVEQNRLRSGEARTIYGSNRKLRRATGWKPSYRLSDTLRDLFNYWRAALLKSKK